MKKRLLALLLALVMVFALAACGSDKDNQAENSKTPDATADTPLEEHMTLVIGPRVMPEGMAPYCCMDVFVVTGDGCEPLYPADRALQEI